MADIEDQTVIITGASSGIGAAAARQLASMGAKVIIVGRTPTHAKTLASQIDSPYYLADFAKLSDVRDLANNLLENHLRIDVLINNAGGIMNNQREVTEDGHEKTFQVNYLAGFLLTRLLMERLVESGARVINTSSAINRSSFVDLDDLENIRRYRALQAYGAAKLMNIIHAAELQRRYGAYGLNAASFHPGNVATQFAHDSDNSISLLYKTFLAKLFLTRPDKGAATMVWLASTAPGTDWLPGEYYEKRRLARANSQAYDPELGRDLWEISDVLARTGAFL